MESIISDQEEAISSEPEKIAKAKMFRVTLEENIATIETEDGEKLTLQRAAIARIRLAFFF
jgi:hypothetical protein